MKTPAAALCLAASALLPATAVAHHRTARQVLDALQSPASREASGIETAWPHPGLGRLLVIRVGPVWFQMSAAERLRLAEGWRRLWREAVRDGVVSVVDAANGEPVVSFDARGRARWILRAGP